jgi:hypothetical protein
MPIKTKKNPTGFWYTIDGLGCLNQLNLQSLAMEAASTILLAPL